MNFLTVPLMAAIFVTNMAGGSPAETIVNSYETNICEVLFESFMDKCERFNYRFCRPSADDIDANDCLQNMYNMCVAKFIRENPTCTEMAPGV
jgi:hypothetical protein